MWLSRVGDGVDCHVDEFVDEVSGETVDVQRRPSVVSPSVGEVNIVWERLEKDLLLVEWQFDRDGIIGFEVHNDLAVETKIDSSMM